MIAKGRRRPATEAPEFVTIAVKPDTYSRLLEIKTRYGLKSFDDVVRLLLGHDVRLA